MYVYIGIHIAIDGTASARGKAEHQMEQVEAAARHAHILRSEHSSALSSNGSYTAAGG